MWAAGDVVGACEDGDDDEDVESLLSVRTLPESSCLVVGDVKGSEVIIEEVRSGLTLSVLLWLLQEWDCFSPSVPLTASPLKTVPLSQVIREGSSGGEEVRGGTLELGRVDRASVVESWSLCLDLDVWLLVCL